MVTIRFYVTHSMKTLNALWFLKSQTLFKELLKLRSLSVMFFIGTVAVTFGLLSREFRSKGQGLVG